MGVDQLLKSGWGSPIGVSPIGSSPNGGSPIGGRPSPLGVSQNGGSPIGGSPNGGGPFGFDYDVDHTTCASIQGGLWGGAHLVAGFDNNFHVLVMSTSVTIRRYEGYRYVGCRYVVDAAVACCPRN